MHRVLFIFLLLIFFMQLEIAGDTLSYPDDKIIIKGKILEKNALTIKFAVNIFNKTRNDYSPLIITEDRCKVEVIEEKSDTINDFIPKNAEEFCTFAEQNIAQGNFNRALQNFEKAKFLFENLSEEIKKEKQNLQKRIYQGLLRFHLLDFLAITGNPMRFKQSKNSIKPYAIAADVTYEYIDYLYIKLNPLIKANKDSIQELMRLAIKVLRVYYKELLNSRVQNKNPRRAQYLKFESENSLNSLRAIYENPQSAEAFQGLLNIRLLLRSNIMRKLISQKFKDSELTKINEFFQSSLSKELMQISELTKLKKLFEFWFEDNQKAQENINFLEKIKKIEKIWKKSLNTKQIAEILNADIIQYKKDNQDLFNNTASELNSSEFELLELINQHRELFGLIPLINKHTVLGETARKYLRVLAKMDKISHIGSDGSTPLTRAQKEGWRTQNVAENLYRGEVSNVGAKRVFEAWLDAPAHNLNIINESFDCCGIANSARDWILLLAGP